MPKRKDDLSKTTGSLRNFAVRRACKFLLYDSIDKGLKIAYTLDDMDVKKVVTDWAIPLKEEGRPTKNKVPVCTSEIREVFRNWDYLKAHVFFFKEFKLVPPPWNLPTCSSEDLQLWAKYARNRAQKLKKKYEKSDDRLYATVKNNVEQAAKSDIPVKILEFFHASKPSLFNHKYALPVDNEAHDEV